MKTRAEEDGEGLSEPRTGYVRGESERTEKSRLKLVGPPARRTGTGWLVQGCKVR